jgi:hypothetical protein
MAWKRSGATAVALAFLSLAAAGCSGVTAPNSPAPVDGGWTPTDGGFVYTDALSPVDTGPLPPNDASAACAPAGVQSYQPQWTPPKRPAAACTAGELSAYGACLDDTNSAACSPWSSASATCKSCVVDSKQTDPAWGPMVDFGTTSSDREVNLSGCVAIVLHDTGSGCAGSVQALDVCEAVACADNCAGESTGALSSCTQQADGAGCKNYVAPASCVEDGGSGVSACFAAVASPTFGQIFVAAATVFCTVADGG